MQERLDVIQRIGGSSPDVRPCTRSAERSEHSVLVERAVNPCEVAEAGGGECLHLTVIVIEQDKVKILRFSPVAIPVQGAPHHGIQGALDVVPAESRPHVSRRRRRRVVKRPVLMTHDRPI